MFLTHTGKMVDLLDMRRDDFCIEDIAHGLSHCCRYNGQTSRFYSVAEHCVRLSEWAMFQGRKINIARYLLLHDASEAYVGDIVYHLKKLLPDFIRIEEEILDSILIRYGVITTSEEKAIAKMWDRSICVDEMRELMPSLDPAFQTDGIINLQIKIEGWTPEVAKQRYMSAFSKLFNI